MTPPSWSVVVPTLGRDSLAVLLGSLARQQHQPAAVILVDDRPGQHPPLDTEAYPGALVVAGRAAGPAAARNLGWRQAGTEWVVFVDDDVVLPDDWSRRLVADLQHAGVDVGGSQAQVRVPMPADRRPTDWERGTAGLMTAAWVTAEMAYRAAALAEVGGFDERFPRAYREDSDLALRVARTGYRLVHGARWVVHPVRPVDPWISLRQQRGNRDDALMRALHGASWREAAGCPPGRLPGHVATVLAAAGAVALALARRRRAAAVPAGVWALLAAEFTWRRVAPGPRTRAEVRAMVLTSVTIPFSAVWHRLAGAARWRGAGPWAPPVQAVLLDRDGTLVADVPYNGDPDRVRPVAGAREALGRLRSAGIKLGVVTNQSAVGRGSLTMAQVEAVNARVEEMLGPFDVWQVCPHSPDDGCDCRKPRPGMVAAAAAELGVAPADVVVIGDIGADVDAAAAAGARGILVPTALTRAEEVRAARCRAGTLGDAVDRILVGR